MADTTKPMTGEQLQAIRDRVESVRGKTFFGVASLEGSTQLGADNQTRADREALLAEVDHQRENYRALLNISTAALDGKNAEMATMRAIMERLANACTCASAAKGLLGHDLTCMSFEARAYLASHPPSSGGR